MNEQSDFGPSSRYAKQILDAFDRYQSEFTAITKRSRERFCQRDWAGVHRDGLERLDLYPREVHRAVDRLLKTAGRRVCQEAVWSRAKQRYEAAIRGRDDGELAETFYNSVVRRLFSVMGVNRRIEFTAGDFRVPHIEDRDCPICETYAGLKKEESTGEMVRQILGRYSSEFAFQDMGRDSERVAQAIDAHFSGDGEKARIDLIEVISAVFYRDKAAYIIGRIRTGLRLHPLVIALLSQNGGVVADAVLLTGEEISILFSFTRAYFHVFVERPAEVVNFLKTIIPRKRVSEIYTSIGFHKHGKAELYRELIRSLEKTSDQFEIARGEKGMVMLVFTLPAFDVVFKVIRDRFEFPKSTTREAVRKRYQLVFRHDRAGRLVDAQEFEHLEFDKSGFSPELLAEFEASARESVEIRGERVIIRHLYTERRLTPLDLYVKEAPPYMAQEAVIDYGQAMKELAATNIFPGDLFLKNFGVTRHGRVVFYDYDELCFLTECRFRKIPRSRGYDDELAPEPWFHVGAHDVFPEEFRTFLRFPDHLKDVFETAHGDLFDPGFWKAMQDRLNSGAVIHIFPYKENRRFSGKK